MINFTSIELSYRKTTKSPVKIVFKWRKLKAFGGKTKIENSIFTDCWIIVFIFSYLKWRVKIKHHLYDKSQFSEWNPFDWKFYAAGALQRATWEVSRQPTLRQSLCASEGGSIITWKKSKVYVLVHGHIDEINMFNSQRNKYFIRWHNLLITLKLKHGAICSNNHDYAVSGPNATV